jgi:hypothetical protein
VNESVVSGLQARRMERSNQNGLAAMTIAGTPNDACESRGNFI